MVSILLLCSIQPGSFESDGVFLRELGLAEGFAAIVNSFTIAISSKNAGQSRISNCVTLFDNLDRDCECGYAHQESNEELENRNACLHH